MRQRGSAVPSRSSRPEPSVPHPDGLRRGYGNDMRRPSLIYALHSGNLYGTERMALATAAGLASEFDCCIMAPPGPALEEAAHMGFHAIPFQGATEFSARLWRRLEERCPVAFFATGVMHSGVCI